MLQMHVVLRAKAPGVLPGQRGLEGLRGTQDPARPALPVSTQGPGICSACVWNESLGFGFLGRSPGGLLALWPEGQPGVLCPLASAACPPPASCCSGEAGLRGSGSIWKLGAEAWRGPAQSYQLGGLAVPICGQCTTILHISLSGRRLLACLLFLICFCSPWLFFNLYLSLSLCLLYPLLCVHTCTRAYLCYMHIRTHTFSSDSG